MWLPSATRRPFRRLRSLHLTRFESTVHTAPPTPPTTSRTTPLRSIQERPQSASLRPRFPYPLSSASLAGLFFLTCFLFVAMISLAFVGHSKKTDLFKAVLANVTTTNPGIVLLGEDVDVDIDEPSISIRWSILACGKANYLDGSGGIHGVEDCGLPKQQLSVFLDSASTPEFVYNPSSLPISTRTGSHRSIQNLVHFDADYTLDVHQAYLYPFDTYMLSGTLRLVDSSNSSVPIVKLETVKMLSSWDISISDIPTTQTVPASSLSRDFDMRVSRPNFHRAIAMLLFLSSWILTLVALGGSLFSCRYSTVDARLVFIAVGIVCMITPKLRDSMPDAPGLDGVLIDSIGFFPQIIVASSCMILLFALGIIRERDRVLKVKAELLGRRLTVEWPIVPRSLNPHMAEFVFPQNKESNIV